MAKELAVSNNKMMSVVPIAYSQACNIELLGGISDRQQYDGITETYSPDYAIRPCVFMPHCKLINPDNPYDTGDCNSILTSFSWIEISASGQQTVVASSEKSSIVSGYSTVIEGNDRGKLTISKNSTLGTHRTLRFRATWTDPVSGYVYTFIKDKALYLEDCTNARAEIMIDVASTVMWNPLRHNSTQPINVSVMVGAKDMTSNAKTRIWWYRILNNGSKELITSADGCYELTSVTKAANGQVTGIVVNEEMIGDSIGYEVRACYIYSGSIPSSPREADARKETKIKRYFPPLTAKFIGSASHVSQSVAAVLCKAVVSDNIGVIDSSVWQEYIRARWDKVTFSQVTNNGVVSMVESSTTLGYGETFLCPVDEGKAIRLVLEDRGAYCVLTDDSGNALADDNGNVLISREIDSSI